MNYFKKAAHVAVVLLLIAGACFGATGDIKTPIIAPSGYYAIVGAEAFSPGATYATINNGSTNNDPTKPTVVATFTVTSMGYDQTGSATTVTRTVYGTVPVRIPYSAATIAGSFTAGTFVDLETATQTGTAATAVILGQKQSAGTKLLVKSVTGSPNNSGVWTGAGGATFAPSATPTRIDGALSTASSQPAQEFSDGTNLWFLLALSDCIYAKDKSGGGNSGTDVTMSMSAGFVTNTAGAGQTSNAVTNLTCTNSSGLAYPKVIGHFASPQRRAVNGTLPIEVWAAHKYARNNSPVACCKITSVGGTSTSSITNTITGLTKSVRGDGVPVYYGNPNLSTTGTPAYTRGELVTSNFVCYPWIGDSGATLSSSGDSGGKTYLLGPLYSTIMDPMIAVVDGVGGATPTASTSQVTADLATNAFATIGAAITGIQTANNTAFSLNRIDGGVVQLKANSAYTGGNYGAQTQTNGNITFMPHSSTNQAGVVFATIPSSFVPPQWLRLYNVTLTRSTNNDLWRAGADGAVTTAELCNFADAQAGDWWYNGGHDASLEAFDCTYNNNYFLHYGNGYTSRFCRNLTFTNTHTSDSAMIGNCGCILALQSTNAGGKQIRHCVAATIGANNAVMAHCRIYNLTAGIVDNWDSTAALTNIAYVGNVIERTGDSGPIFSIAAGVTQTTAANIYFGHNTWKGQRWNIVGAQSGTSYTATDVCMLGNIGDAFYDDISDISHTNGALVNWWARDYSVGCRANWNESISSAGENSGNLMFLGLNSNTTAFPGTVAATNSLAGFINDQSQYGGGGGNSNFMLKSSSKAANALPPGTASTLIDINGVYVRNNGTGDIGAVQRPNQSLLLAF